MNLRTRANTGARRTRRERVARGCMPAYVPTLNRIACMKREKPPQQLSLAVPGMRNILSLFDYTGSWSKPYRDAGYNVVQIDIKHSQDVRLLTVADLPMPVHGILAAPPCDHFASSGAAWWESKGNEKLLEGLALVDATLRIIQVAKPQWWVLENPVGRLMHYIGNPVMYFQPCDYGDPYTKKTGLWGEFNPDLPANPVDPVEGSKMHTNIRSKTNRSITPEGFAQAFFEANP